MPAITYDGKTNWADDVDDEIEDLPPPTEVYKNNQKFITEYKYNDDDQKVKVVRTYKIEKRILSKSIAERKNWAKFGDSKNDRPGPNPATTIIAEEVSMSFISNKDDETKTEEDGFEKLRNMGDKNFRCRMCSGEHWTSKCPYKDTILGGEKFIDDKKASLNSSMASGATSADAAKPRYVPPSLREGGNKRGDSYAMQRRDDTAAIRISNLSENVTDQDLEDLVKPFGPVQKTYLAKEKTSNKCKGFAYVHFRSRSDAQKAINKLNGHGYEYLILSVDWSQPRAT